MTAPITGQKARQLRLEDYYDYLRTQNPTKYAKHLRQQQELQERERFWKSPEGQSIQAEVETFLQTPEMQAFTSAWEREWQDRRVGFHRSSYELLGLENGATKRDIKNAYRRQARKLHPDKGGDEAAFKALHAAYRQLLTVTKD